MMIAKRILLAVAATMAVAAIAISIGVGGHVLPAWAQDILPPAAPAPPALGNPTNLTATTGGRGEVNISFNPAVGATVHWVWRVKPDNTGGVWVKGAADSQQTVTGLTPGQAYYFIVIAGRPQATGSGMLWSSWSNWAEAVTGAASTGATPTPTPTRSAPLPASPVNGDYDHDDDGLIEIRSIAQLDAIRHDLDGDGAVDKKGDVSAYAAAFPGTAAGMGCPTAGCTGYELATDLDYGTQVSAQGWQPIGYYRSSSNNAPFTATFDGGGHTISNLHISRTNANYVGLFGFSDGSIRRAELQNVNVVSDSGVGGVVGRNNGTITDSYVTGNVIGNGRYVGGLVGYNRDDGTIIDSYATSNVVGVREVGGLVGYNYGGTITGSHATGAVSSDGGSSSALDAVGGLVGRNHGGTVAHSYSTGAVSSAVTSSTYLGGLIGHNSSGGDITDSYATGEATGGGSAGGLVGYNENGAITRSHADAYVSGSSSRAGGLVGHNKSAITASYATGWVEGGMKYIGGLVGHNAGNGTVTASYATNWVDSDQSRNATQYIGGLVGDNDGTITGSYAAGHLFSYGGHRGNYNYYDYLGGLVARNKGTITGSYSTVTVSANPGVEYVSLSGLVQKNSGSVVFSYWDTQASEQNSSDAGAGKTTAELQSPTSNAGIYATWNPNWWDFGTSQQYPVLKVDGLSVAEQRDYYAVAPGAGNTTPAAEDRAALVALYEATGGLENRWTNEDGWLSDAPLGQWHGVTTDDDGRVTKLILSSNNLTGSIPADLAGLTRLRTLTLRGNLLSGEIPDLSALSDTLGWLNLEHNELSGAIPLWLGDFTQLRGLGLGHNRLSGTIPAELANLNNLRVLYLDQQSYFRGQAFPTNFENIYTNDFYYLHGSIPAELGNLDNLEVLDLSDNRLSGNIPRRLGYLGSLETLTLSGNKLDGSIPTTLSDRTGVEGPDSDGLGLLKNLTRLNLSGNRLSGNVPSELAFLKNLETLNLGRNQLTGTMPGLSNLTNLNRLYLQGNSELQGAIPLAALSNLTALNLQGTQVSVAPSQHANLAAIQRDREALVALYETAGGNRWSNNDDWNSGEPIALWKGVTVATEFDPDRPGRVGRVVALDLRDEISEEVMADWIETVVNYAGDPNAALFWLESLNVHIIADADGGDVDELEHSLAFVSPQPGFNVEATTYEKSEDGTLKQIAQSTVTVLNAASPAVKSPIAGYTWGARLIKWSGGPARSATRFITRVAESPAGKLGTKLNLLGTIVTSVLHTELVECLAVEGMLHIGLVERGVGQEIEYSKCESAVDNFVSDAISSALLDLNFVDLVESVSGVNLIETAKDAAEYVGQWLWERSWTLGYRTCSVCI